MAQRELLRLRRVVVDGLFGIYDHDFHLKLDDRVTLLHGPNGVGKTVVLGMIDSLLRKRIAETLVQYGRESQALDQTFPRRLISAKDEMPVDDLRKQMSTLDQRTAELRKIGVLNETPPHPFSVDNLAGMDLRVMTLYVRDTEKKLEVLDDLAKRVRLLLEHVNQKYRHKTIEPDREHGFVAKSDKGQPLPLQSLSSGEQQELVLHYDLLFRVPSNTIVLLDEPELSLHVAWQKRFLPDLLKIVELSNFDALVATHSPYVVGDRDDLMVGLGDAR